MAQPKLSLSPKNNNENAAGILLHEHSFWIDFWRMKVINLVCYCDSLRAARIQPFGAIMVVLYIEGSFDFQCWLFVKMCINVERWMLPICNPESVKSRDIVTYIRWTKIFKEIFLKYKKCIYILRLIIFYLKLDRSKILPK